MMILNLFKSISPFWFTVWYLCPKYNFYRRLVALLTMFLSSFSKDIYDQMELNSTLR